MTYHHITTNNYTTYDIKFSHIVVALQQCIVDACHLTTFIHKT